MVIEKPIQHYPDGKKFVYFHEEKFVGSFLIVKNEIWDVMIFKRFRGNGFCVEMLWEFLSENPGKWILYVHKENIPARKSYEKLGFVYKRNLEIDFIELLEMEFKN